MISENRDQNLFLGFILLFFCFALLFNLGGRTLENNDYLHYAEIGREILETGDWVIMHNGGKIYVDKPPLHSMNMALSFKLFGVSPFAARFPGAFFGLAGVLATFFFGMRIKQGQDLKTGIYASLLLLSSYGYFFLTRRPRNDIEYAVLFSLCLILFYEGYETSIKKHKFLFYALFWTCMGFAALVKGPAAFLPLLIIALYLFIQKGWKQAGGKAFFATSLLLPAVVLPYLILLVLHKDFPEFMTILKNHTIMTRSGGPLYYIPVFFEKYFPAGIFLALSLPVLWKEKKIFRENPRMAFVLTWACVYLFSIQLIKAKVYRYLLPAFPPLSIITAWGVQKLLEKKALPESLWRYGKILAGILCLGWPIVIWVFRGWSWPDLIL
ncbi:MAG: glycosyltransferase family 39 protein, partial [Pseudomonadota bacterium]